MMTEFHAPPANDGVCERNTTGLSRLLAMACAGIAANIYYAQPIASQIAVSLNMPGSMTGLIVTLTQLGYGVGLLLVVPLADISNNRRLVFILLGLTSVALILVSVVTAPSLLLMTLFCVGLGSVAVQILVPLAAYLAPDATRGRAVGNVMAGLMLGIMLARPVASLITFASTWQVVFRLSAGVMVALMVVLHRALPDRSPLVGANPAALLLSMWQLWNDTPALRRRAFYHACMFASFSVFWTNIGQLLAGPVLGLNQAQIALFSLAGVAGAVAAPIAGRLADRGFTRVATKVVLLAAALLMLSASADVRSHTLLLGLFVFVAIALDFMVTVNLVLGQRVIFSYSEQVRSRLNGLYMFIFFVGGALGSGLGGWAFSGYGWHGAALLGAAFPAAAFVYSMTE